MKGDIDLREINLKKLRVSRNVWILLAVAVLLGVGGYLGWRTITTPPRPWLVRWRLNRYLSKQAHTSDFAVKFPFPAKAEMAKSPKSNEDDKGPVRGSRTGKDFETLREEYLTQKIAALALQREIVRSETSLKEAQSKLNALLKQTTGNSASASSGTSDAAPLREQIAGLEKAAARRPELQAKEEALAPLVDDLWEFQRAWNADAAASDSASASALAKARAQLLRDSQEKLNGASSYEAMYHAVGQELFVARRLLGSGNREHRREGVTIALAAARQALGYAMNGYVAARICEGYILPNLDLATDRNTRSTFNEENLLSQCADIFRRNEEPNNVVRVYELYLESTKNPARADWARAQIAMAYRQSGDSKHELAALRQIKDTNSFRFQMRRIAQLEQEAKTQR